MTGTATLAPPLAQRAQHHKDAIETAAAAAGVCLPHWNELPGCPDRVLACSEFVARSLVRDPALLADLFHSKDLARDYLLSDQANPYARRLDAILGQTPERACLIRGVRTLRRREMVRIAWRDIGALACLETTVGETSALADGVLHRSLGHLHRLAVRDYGQPLGDGEPQQLTVLALGKLGAEELNFSSDIDLILLYAKPGETSGARRSIANETFFQRLGQQLAQTLEEKTELGTVFRVDLRLRPFGASGPLVMHANAMLDYYETHGRDWERYALIRARPVAGDIRCGEDLLRRLQAFMYRRYLDFGALESMRAMKALIRDEVARKDLHHHVKLGAGGIREIEFTVQAFQMVRGGRQPELRGRRTLSTLEILGKRGYLPQDAVGELCEAYRFLRTVEHRLQQVQDRQTHTLPKDDFERTRLAAGMGFCDWQGFEKVLRQHRHAVAKHFNRILGQAAPQNQPDGALKGLLDPQLQDDTALGLLSGLGFEPAKSAWELLRGLLQSYNIKALDGRGRGRFERLLPDLLREAGAQPQPLTCLQRLVHVIETIARRSVYLALLLERPLALSQLVRLSAASAWIARQIARHPLLLDELLDASRLYAPLGRNALQADLTQRFAHLQAGDTEQEMATLRHFMQAHVLRVAAGDLSQTVALTKVSEHLTHIAEIILAKAKDLAWRDLCGRYGRPCYVQDGLRQRARFALVAYGKLGGRELGYGSDLDLVFLHDSQGQQQQTAGDRCVDNAVFFGRLAQRIIHFLSTATPEGTLYEVDSRLRPGGRKGLLVHTLDAYRRYLLEEAWTWEHQALVRARVILGGKALRQGFRRLRREVLLLKRDPEKLRHEVRDMRGKMQRHLSRSGDGDFDLKQDVGGITDIEFMVQYGVLRWASRLGPWLDYTDNIRLLTGFGRCGLLAAGDVAVLCDAYRCYRHHSHALALQQQAGVIAGAGVAKHRQGVIRIWQQWMEQEPGADA